MLLQFWKIISSRKGIRHWCCYILNTPIYILPVFSLKVVKILKSPLSHKKIICVDLNFEYQESSFRSISFHTFLKKGQTLKWKIINLCEFSLKKFFNGTHGQKKSSVEKFQIFNNTFNNWIFWDIFFCKTVRSLIFIWKLLKNISSGI